MSASNTIVGNQAVMATYARQDVAFERGEGAWLMTADGDRYLDFTSGIAVTALGHAHPRLVEALKEQADKLWHTSNLYRIAGQERLAERLAHETFADQVFFCNSGAEACEGAIKTARRYFAVGDQPERWRIITFSGAFHGRTLATLSAGNNPKHLEGFGPRVDGFDTVAFGDHDGVKAAIGPETAAIMVEPVLGEGGARTIPDTCLVGLRELCDEHGILLIFDEVQTGIGRTGKLFAHEWSGVTPDIMALAKGLGSGFPMGAFVATQEAARGMTAGTHGSTFGGNPLAMAVGNAVLDVVLDPGFMEAVQQKALRLRQGLAELQDMFPGQILDVRGRGLLSGVKLAAPIASFTQAALQEKLLVVGAGDNVIRILPPLTIDEADIGEGLRRFAGALRALDAA
ncbi:MAG: aspartate aminotransferase family protein [Hyphomicrobiaceae bacterium]